jgi:hypothetical protein
MSRKIERGRKELWAAKLLGLSSVVTNIFLFLINKKICIDKFEA